MSNHNIHYVQDYQALASRTLLDTPDHEYTGQELMLVWNAVGLAEEAGEVNGWIKKVVFHRHTPDYDKLKKELGDVLWYLTGICTVHGWTLQEIMELNIDKLEKRYAKDKGYTSEQSIGRTDE